LTALGALPSLSSNAPFQVRGLEIPAGRESPPRPKKTAEPPAFTELLKRVANLTPDDPERERKAFRYFLEAALVSDLGANLINDPKFHQLVDIVQQRMEAQPELLAASQRAARLLLQIPPSK